MAITDQATSAGQQNEWDRLAGKTLLRRKLALEY